MAGAACTGIPRRTPGSRASGSTTRFIGRHARTRASAQTTRTSTFACNLKVCRFYDQRTRCWDASAALSRCCVFCRATTAITAAGWACLRARRTRTLPSMRLWRFRRSRRDMRQETAAVRTAVKTRRRRRKTKKTKKKKKKKKTTAACQGRGPALVRGPLARRVPARCGPRCPRCSKSTTATETAATTMAAAAHAAHAAVVVVAVAQV